MNEENIIIDESIVNLLGAELDEEIMQECRERPKKAGIIVKSHLYDKMLVNEVPKIAVVHKPEGLIVKVH